MNQSQTQSAPPRSDQAPARVGFLGPAGTFSQEAVRACLFTANAEAVPYKTIPQVYEAVLAGEVQAGMLPIENSLEGSVNQTLDLLVHRGGLLIRRELALSVSHNLLAAEGTSLADVQGILSHPQALAQCAEFLRRTFPGLPQEPSASTADAARQIAEGARLGWAALGTLTAAELYGLKVLARNVQDSEANHTRFVLVMHQDEAPTGDDKTSIAFSLDRDRPGGLYEMLGVFARRQINLTKIESRPARSGLGSYIFLADMEGHAQDPVCAEALEELRGMSFFFRLLGSYPRWRETA